MFLLCLAARASFDNRPVLGVARTVDASRNVQHEIARVIFEHILRSTYWHFHYSKMLFHLYRPSRSHQFVPGARRAIFKVELLIPHAGSARLAKGSINARVPLLVIRGSWWPTADMHHRKLEEESLLRKAEAEDAKAHAAALERTAR